MHEHEFQGQKLRHGHAGGERPHGYFEHPEDGSSGNVARLQSSGRVTAGGHTDAISTAEDYARFAAVAMNAARADDTEFIADGATVTAYVHCLAHMSATFAPDEDRPYPGGGDYAPSACRYCGAEIRLVDSAWEDDLDDAPASRYCTGSTDHVHEPNEGYFEVTPADWTADEFLTLRVNTTLMSNTDTLAEVLRYAAELIREGNTDRTLFDGSGNEIGDFHVR